MAYYAFCRRADDIADGDFVDVFPGGSADDPESLAYRESIERLSPGDQFSTGQRIMRKCHNFSITERNSQQLMVI